jgi:hypothetical protein
LAELGYDRAHDVVVLPYPKGFYKTRMPEPGLDTWAMPGKGLAWPLYVVNEDRVQRCRWALLCEGDWDTLRAEASALPAVGLPQGAATWRQHWVQQLADLNVQTVVLCLDVGAERHAQRHAVALRGQKNPQLAVKVLDLRDLGLTKKNADLSDWLQNGGSRTELRERIGQL